MCVFVCVFVCVLGGGVGGWAINVAKHLTESQAEGTGSQEGTVMTEGEEGGALIGEKDSLLNENLLQQRAIRTDYMSRSGNNPCHALKKKEKFLTPSFFC